MVHFLYGRETIPFIGSMEFKSTEFKTNSEKTNYTNKNIMMVLQKINHRESFNFFFNYINSFKLIMMRIVKSQLEKTIKEYQYIIEGRLIKYPRENIVILNSHQFHPSRGSFIKIFKLEFLLIL